MKSNSGAGFKFLSKFAQGGESCLVDLMLAFRVALLSRIDLRWRSARPKYYISVISR